MSTPPSSLLCAFGSSTPIESRPARIDRRAVKLKDDETVIFAWIVYESREQRDQINAKVMQHPRLKDMMDPKALPFDGKRMFWGGFEEIVTA